MTQYGVDFYDIKEYVRDELDKGSLIKFPKDTIIKIKQINY